MHLCCRGLLQGFCVLSLQVGKAWLYLSKAYQNFGSKGNQAEYKEKSEAALFRRGPPSVLSKLQPTL